MIFNTIFCFLPVIGSGCCQTWNNFFVFPLLLGLGLGSKTSTVPIFTVENNPASIRGLMMSWWTRVAFGIFLGFCANLVLQDVGRSAWSLGFGSAFLPVLPLIFGIFFYPESLRWYLKKGQYHDAYASLVKLRNTALQAGELHSSTWVSVYSPNPQLTICTISTLSSRPRPISSGSKATWHVVRFIEPSTIPRNRHPTTAAFTATIGQQMCGSECIFFALGLYNVLTTRLIE